MSGEQIHKPGEEVEVEHQEGVESGQIDITGDDYNYDYDYTYYDAHVPLDTTTKNISIESIHLEEDDDGVQVLMIQPIL